MKPETICYRHALLLRGAQLAGITVEDLGRALASMDGQLAAFDADRDRGNLAVNSIYAHGIVRAETLIERATEYARERRAGAKGG
jgi:hypothetical protein